MYQIKINETPAGTDVGTILPLSNKNNLHKNYIQVQDTTLANVGHPVAIYKFVSAKQSTYSLGINYLVFEKGDVLLRTTMSWHRPHLESSDWEKVCDVVVPGYILPTQEKGVWVCTRKNSGWATTVLKPDLDVVHNYTFVKKADTDALGDVTSIVSPINKRAAIVAEGRVITDKHYVMFKEHILDEQGVKLKPSIASKTHWHIIKRVSKTSIPNKATLDTAKEEKQMDPIEEAVLVLTNESSLYNQLVTMHLDKSTSKYHHLLYNYLHNNCLELYSKLAEMHNGMEKVIKQINNLHRTEYELQNQINQPKETTMSAKIEKNVTLVNNTNSHNLSDDELMDLIAKEEHDMHGLSRIQAHSVSIALKKAKYAETIRDLIAVLDARVSKE
jgi:hypothetical protein